MVQVIRDRWIGSAPHISPNAEIATTMEGTLNNE